MVLSMEWLLISRIQMPFSAAIWFLFSKFSGYTSKISTQSQYHQYNGIYQIEHIQRGISLFFHFHIFV